MEASDGAVVRGWGSLEDGRRRNAGTSAAELTGNAAGAGAGAGDGALRRLFIEGGRGRGVEA